LTRKIIIVSETRLALTLCALHTSSDRGDSPRRVCHMTTRPNLGR
jgi:hypothetical protein